jgi:OmpA-like transmembrane domain
VWRRAIFGLVLACGVAPLLFASAASATDLPPPVYKPVPVAKAPVVVSWSQFYVGAAINWVHHTGYVPDSPWSAEAYTFGAKAFGGYRLNPWVQFELAYHYLGEISFVEGQPQRSHERSQAVAASVMLVSDPISKWIGPTHVPIVAFVRFGLAYKDVHHDAWYGTFHEGFLSGVFGAGWEYRISPSMFVRVEYEFLSTAIGGPPHAVPAINSLFQLTFGGTRNAINVMHTPLAITLGWNL